jgi:hypothetical protein
MNKKEVEEKVLKEIQEIKERFQKQKDEEEKIVTFSESHNPDPKKFLAIIKEKIQKHEFRWSPGCYKTEDGKYEKGALGRTGPYGKISSLSKTLRIVSPIHISILRTSKQIESNLDESDIQEIIHTLPLKGNPTVIKEYYPSNMLAKVAGKCFSLSIMCDEECEIFQLLKTTGILKETFPNWYKEQFFEPTATWEEKDLTETKPKTITRTIKEYSERAKSIHPGSVYKHYKKGDLYRALTIARTEKNQEEMVVYESEVTKDIWIRPVTEFLEDIDGISRFSVQ